MLTNANRAEYAESALVKYATDKGLIIGGESMETALNDILTDLMHLARLSGLDFDASLESARHMHGEESDSEDDGAFIGAEVWPLIARES